ncbi:MAG: hypothetical protein DRH12_17155 [Deltaproteobacteria bacterium]|nr:MAG: hypothetical protein DRG83_19560 [Deltaproteobacteria bacterium]RLB34779.1 MAG: hypothetical protein DRH12_17155 [Deltaproteobacteria bacterium]
MRKAALIWLIFVFGLLIASAAFCADTEIVPMEDREINHRIDTGETIMLNDGQSSPKVEFCSSPIFEQRFVIKFDLSAYHDVKFGQVRFKFFVLQATNISSLRLDAWYYERAGDDITEEDYIRGDANAGQYSWDGVSSGSTTIEQWAELDVTDLVNSRVGDYVYFNIRLSGSYPDYDGNVFDPNEGHYYVNVAAQEFGALSPRLVISSPFVLTGKDRTVYGSITLDGSESYDPDSSLISYQWRLKCRGNPLFSRQASGITATIENLRPGFYDVELTVENEEHKTATGGFIAVCMPGRPGDFNSDGDVDGADLASFANEFGKANR